MIKSQYRNGNFTSSEMVALTGVGKREMTQAELDARPKKGVGSKSTQIEDISILDKAALTYIEETNFERKLGRSLTDESFAKPLAWGTLLEGRVFDLLGLEYVLTSQETKLHPTISYWAGSKDGYKFDEGGTVIDIKCPITLKSFCQLVEPLYNGLTDMDAMNEVRKNHKDGEKYYWQLVSNSIIERAKYAELIVYVPYQSELAEVKMLAQNSNNPEKYYWLSFAGEDELPFINDGGYYKNLNVIRFEVPQEDKDFLTSKVLKAGEMLIPFPKRLNAPDDSLPYVMVVEYKPDERLTLVTD